MSEVEKKYAAPRDLDKIQQDYVNLCTKVGDMQYKVHCIQADIAVVNRQLRELNLEAAASSEAKRKQEEAAKAEESAKAAAPKLAEVPKLEEVSSNG